MVEFITGASGTGKTTEMFERISKYSAGNCIALVPEQYSTEFDKKLYFHIGAEKFNNMLSLSFSSLARQLFQLYGEPDRKGEYADDMARLIITYQAIKEARTKRGESRKNVSDDMDISPRYLANIENKGQQPSLQIFYELVTRYDISVDQYFFPDKSADKSTMRRQLDTLLDGMSDKGLHIVTETAKAVVEVEKENKN